MEDFVKALTELISTVSEHEKPNEFLGLNEQGAPESIAKLLGTLRSRSYPRLALGQYDVNGAGFRQVRSAVDAVADIDEVLEMDDTSVAQIAPDFDPAKALEFASWSGMSTLALSWGRDKIEVAVLEHEEPMPDNAIVLFDDASAFRTFLTQNLDPGVRGWDGVIKLLGGDA